MIRVLVADDHALVRRGLVLVLEHDPGIAVVGEVADGAAAVEAALRLAPDVVLLDARMPGVDGVEAVRRIRAAGSTARLVVLTSYDHDEYLLGALRAGADGFLLKDIAPDQLLHGVRAAAAGGAPIAPSATRRLVDRWTRPPSPGGDPTAEDPRMRRLTRREREVLDWMGRGLSNAEIAERMVVSGPTVKSHVSRLLAKLGLRDRTQAVAFVHGAGPADRDELQPCRGEGEAAEGDRARGRGVVPVQRDRGGHQQ